MKVHQDKSEIQIMHIGQMFQVALLRTLGFIVVKGTARRSVSCA